MYHDINKHRKNSLKKVNALYKNLQFTLEIVDANGELVFHGMNMCDGKENFNQVVP